MIFSDVSLKISTENELKSVLMKFHDFITNLKHLARSNFTNKPISVEKWHENHYYIINVKDYTDTITHQNEVDGNYWRKIWRINADLKISLYVCVQIKIISWKFHIPNPKNSRVIYPKVCEMFVHKHTETIEYVKN